MRKRLFSRPFRALRDADEVEKEKHTQALLSSLRANVGRIVADKDALLKHEIQQYDAKFLLVQNEKDARTSPKPQKLTRDTSARNPILEDYQLKESLYLYISSK